MTARPRVSAQAYTWGSNINGQLGLGHRRPVQRPALARSFKEKGEKPMLVSSVHSGGNYNAVTFSTAIQPPYSSTKG
jgi:alpha-tubulin suppressor-like RCC1 family protein